jgi:hypothetical protein
VLGREGGGRRKEEEGGGRRRGGEDRGQGEGRRRGREEEGRREGAYYSFNNSISSTISAVAPWDKAILVTKSSYCLWYPEINPVKKFKICSFASFSAWNWSSVRLSRSLVNYFKIIKISRENSGNFLFVNVTRKKKFKKRISFFLEAESEFRNDFNFSRKRCKNFTPSKFKILLKCGKKSNESYSACLKKFKNKCPRFSEISKNNSVRYFHRELAV